MKVLVTKPSLYERDELEEFFQNQSWEPFFAEEPRTMYQMLSRDDYEYPKRSVHGYQEVR